MFSRHKKRRFQISAMELNGNSYFSIVKAIISYHHHSTGTLITDLEGRPHQFFLNLPYGETFIEQGGHTYDNPYKFNGKEFDQETGLYYYGARYYDPKISLWLSVDPKIENNKHQSSYVYTSANPIVLVDPDGKDDFYFDFEWGTYRIVRNNKPNRYFVAQYVFSKDDEEALARGEIVVGELEYKQVSLDDDLIHDRIFQGKHIFKWLLDHAGSEERYKEIYNSYHSVTETDKAKLIGVTLAVGFSPYAVEMLVSELSINSIVELYNIYSNFSTFKDIFTSFEKGDYKMTFALIGIAQRI